MKIIKTVLEPCEAGYQLAVAIQSAPNYWKAYYSTVDQWPTLEDIERVANSGKKMFERSKAEQTFGVLPNLEFEY